MGVRAQVFQKSIETGDSYRIDLVSATYSGSILEMKGMGDVALLSYDNLDAANIFQTPIQSSGLQLTLAVQSDTDKAVIDELFIGSEADYTIKVYKNTVLWWTGTVVMDLSSYEDGQSYPYSATIQAKDLRNLDSTLYPLESNRELVITTLARLLNGSGANLPIKTATSWITANANSSNDFLRQVYNDTRALRQFGKDNDLQITYKTALEWILTSHKCFVRQANGVWWIYQLSAWATPTSVLVTNYNDSGVFQSQANENLTIAANTNDTKVVIGSIANVKPAYKRVNATFAHRTPTDGIVFPEIVSQTVAEPADDIFEQSMEFRSLDINQNVGLYGTAWVRFDEAWSSNVITTEPVVKLSLEFTYDGTTIYWNNALGVWQLTAVDCTFTTRDYANPGRIAPDIDIERRDFFASIPITATNPRITSAFSAFGLGVLRVRLRKAVTPRDSTTSWEAMALIIGSDAAERGQAITSTLSQTADYSVNYDDGPHYFGDGPLNYSVSALRYGTADNALTTEWQRRGTTPDRGHTEQLLKEVMDFHRVYTDLLTANLYGDFTPEKQLSYRIASYAFIGGRFSFKTGRWNATLVKNAFTSDIDNLTVGIIAGPNLVTNGLFTAVSISQSNSLEAAGNYVFRLGLQVSGTVTQLNLIPTSDQYPLLKKDTRIRVVHPVTLDQYFFTLDQDMFAGSLNVAVVSTQVDDPLPRGSYIYTDPGDGAAALIIGRDSIRLIAETTSIGVTTQQSLGPVTSIQVVLNTRVRAGDDLFLVRTLDATKRAFTVGQTAGPGLVTLQLDQSTVFDAPAGSYITGNNAQYEAFLQVTPSGVLAKAEAIGLQNGFAILSAPVGAGTPTNGLPVTSVRTLTLKDAMQIGIQDKAGNTEFFQVDGDQNLTNATTTIDVVEKTPSISVGAGASVFQPQWNQTAILSVQAGEIATRVTETQVQALIDENLGGLLPAENWLFEGTDEGFTTNNVTLTTDTTYIEYLATGSTPYIQKTGLSIDADDNPVVTIRVQRVAGTNWGGAFGWTTDGSNYFTQTFVEPTGVDLDFQFATVDLTSNPNYTGTITGVRLFLGEANLDEFYIDQFIIGKFNPQTEILADLSSRLTVAEAGLTNTANEFTTYTQNAVLTNASAVVAVGRNQTTTYDTVAITDTRGGFTVKDGQDFYLVNVDGTFQAVKIRDDQTVTNVTTPTTYTLKIQSITFSTTIAVGAMLYESAWTQSTRISQSAGQIVLKAIESVPGQGYVDSVALVQLTASVGSGSSVKIKGDLVELNNIQIIRDTGSGLIQTQNFVAGSTGWRIRGTGDAEFNDVTVRGSVFVTGGDAATKNYADNAADDALDDALDNLSVTIRSGTKPTLRPNGDALRSGDVWIDTANGDKPYSYNTSISDFVAAYTQISGGAITTGTINANLVTVSAGSGTVTLTGAGLRVNPSGSNQDVLIDSGGIGLKQSVNSQYEDDKGSAIHWGSLASPSSYIRSYTDTGAVILELYSQSAVQIIAPQFIVTPSAGMFVNGSFASTSVSASTATISTLVVGTQTNKATISYTTNTARTYTIPNVAASNFVMSEGTQTINGSKTFGSAITSPSLIVGSETSKATIAYTTNTARTYTIPNVAASDFVMTAGAQTITGVKAFSSRIDAQSDIRLLDAGAQQLNLSGTGSSVTANRTYTFPDASGEFVITAGNQDIAGTKRFTGTLRASAYRSSDNTAGATENVVTVDINLNPLTLIFKNGLFVGTS